MSVVASPQAGVADISRREPATARASAHAGLLSGADLLGQAAVAALLLYAALVLLYPPALSGAISVPTAPWSIVDVFDLTMAALMPKWLVFPVHTGLDGGPARVVAAGVMLCSFAVALRGR